MKQLEILAIIPARGGSKGVKRKNLRPLNNKPLIAWTFDAAKKSKLITRIVVTTEDSEIAEFSENSKVDVVHRPLELAQDHSTSVDAIKHCLETLEESDYRPDLIVLLQCTSPFRTTAQIDEAINLLLDNHEKFSALISVTKTEHPPWWLKTIDEEGRLHDFIQYDKDTYKRRQDFPPIYQLNGALYIIFTEKFYELNSLETENTYPYIMDVQSSIDIDTEHDLLLAELMQKALAETSNNDI